MQLSDKKSLWEADKVEITGAGQDGFDEGIIEVHILKNSKEMWDCKWVMSFF